MSCCVVCGSGREQDVSGCVCDRGKTQERQHRHGWIDNRDRLHSNAQRTYMNRWVDEWKFT